MADRKKLKNPKGLYHKGTVIDRKTQTVKLFAAQTDGQAQEKKQQHRNISCRVMTYSNAEKYFQKDFEKGSDLPPVFLLLVRGSNNQITGSQIKKEARVFYNSQPQNSISKGVELCKTA